MVTTVGTGNDIAKIIENYIYLERDALAAYDESISRLESPAHKEKVAEFRADHERHLGELKDLAARHGAAVPAEGDMKQMLTTGKIKLADLVGGDGAILKAMATNEIDTITGYENGTNNATIPAAERPIFERALADERRHKEWMDAAAKAA